MPTQDQADGKPPSLVQKAFGHAYFPEEEAVPEKGQQETHGKMRLREPFLLSLLRALSAWPA